MTKSLSDEANEIEVLPPGQTIRIRRAGVHNLKDISLDIPRDRLVVFTGLSGSGKSSLAFDTIYAEGQRRYMESLSSYARQFLGQMEKPDVESIDGLSPAIAIDQKSASKNPRSTVGTITEIWDYLRLLFARAGVQHCIHDGAVVARQSPQVIVDRVLAFAEGTRFQVLAPIVRGRKGTYETLFSELADKGYSRVRIDGEVRDLAEVVTNGANLARYEIHHIEVVVDRLVSREGIERRLTDSLETALALAEGVVQIELVPRADEASAMDSAEGEGAAEILTFSQHVSCPECGASYEEIAPRNFSFNSPYGACSTCDGLGTRYEMDPSLVVPDEDLSVADGAIVPWASPQAQYYKHLLEAASETYGFDLHTPWRKLSKKHRDILLYGSGEGEVEVKYRNRFGRSRRFTTQYEGIVPHLQRLHRETDSEFRREQIAGYMREADCNVCNGARLKPESLAVRVDGRNIQDVAQLPIEAGRTLLGSLELSSRDHTIADPILKEISERMQFLLDVGLGYLTLNRASGSLAGGEAQRIRLASQIGSGLVGVLYVLDEPSIGLHQRDNRRLIETLMRLRDLGNTLVVVEHDEDTIRVADWVVDIGPGAGEHGGEVIHSGSVESLEKNAASITGQYLIGERSIPVPEKRRVRGKGEVLIRKAAANNLREIDVAFPFGLFTAVTGVSGSGKSTLVNEILHKGLLAKVHRTRDVPGRHKSMVGAAKVDKVIAIDQQPIGRTPRSNPATYIGVFDRIRKLYAATPEANVRGYKPGRFSFNVPGGRCEACSGDGTLKIEMHFLPDVYVECEVCHGARFNRDTLDITYKGRTIADVLAMSCEEALEFFQNQESIARHLQTMVDVGLGYVRLGQPATQLSGGEAQRVKLASELSRRQKGHTFYILDEPTTGLHFEDVRKLLVVLQRLVEQGNTLVVIEHNLEVIKTSDWIIDLGPEGGSGGGTVVAEGTPEHVATVEASWTGRYLAPLLD